MQTTYHIQGMHCGKCERKIGEAIGALEGVESVDASASAGTAAVTHEEELDRDSIAAAVRSAGDYTLTGRADEAADNATAAHDNHQPADDKDNGDSDDESIYPLLLIVGYLLGTVVLIAWATDTWQVMPIMRHFMAGFFLTFSFFKLLDLPGFVSTYRGYDLVAKRSAAYAWAYPFIELALGVLFLLNIGPIAVNAVTLVIMLVGSAGVFKALLNKQNIRCGCLGTALNLPMTTVTLVEDLSMAAMASAMLVLHVL